MTPTLQFVELTGQPLADFIAATEETYAQDMHHNGGTSLEQARWAAREATAALFPGGQLAPGNQVWQAVDDAGEPVGFLWLAHRLPGTPDAHAWIYDIEVVPGRRGQGWGRALLERAEQMAREWGLTSLQLNVFGGNEAARSLYRSHGMREQNVVMAKTIG